MPLVSFEHQARCGLGKLFGDHLIDLVVDPSLPNDVIAFLEAGASAISAFRSIEDDPRAAIPLSAVHLMPPVRKPEKFLGIGLNYRDHANEASKVGLQASSTQLWFNKQVSCITGPFDDVVKPAVSDQMDYEAELAVVIGREARHVKRTEARAVIGGYMIANDVSARDWQLLSPTLTLGKSFDTHGPIGPWLVLDHEIRDPHELDIRMFVNGEQRQSSNSRWMIHDIYDQIAFLSTVMTLKPGDILATGTPAGVGFASLPPRFLAVGDVMRVEISDIGHIENVVVAETGANVRVGAL